MSVSETVTFSPSERSVAKKSTSAFKVCARLEECGRESVIAVVVASSAEEGDEEGSHSLQRRDADQEEEEVQCQVPAGECEINLSDLVLEGTGNGGRIHTKWRRTII